jgi:hypothetical protein
MWIYVHPRTPAKYPGADYYLMLAISVALNSWDRQVQASRTIVNHKTVSWRQPFCGELGAGLIIIIKGDDERQDSESMLEPLLRILAFPRLSI